MEYNEMKLLLEFLQTDHPLVPIRPDLLVLEYNSFIDFASSFLWSTVRSAKKRETFKHNEEPKTSFKRTGNGDACHSSLAESLRAVSKNLKMWVRNTRLGTA